MGVLMLCPVLSRYTWMDDCFIDGRVLYGVLQGEGKQKKKVRYDLQTDKMEEFHHWTASAYLS